MKNFRYVARDPQGLKNSGLRQATNSQEVVLWLREEGFTPINVELLDAPESRQKGLFRRKRVKSEDLAALCWQLGTMVEGAVPITEALDIVADDTNSPLLCKTLLEICDRIKSGETFSDALRDYPKVFPSMFCSMVLAGETGGHLPMVLKRMGAYYEERDKLIRKIKGALSYPVFALVVLTLIIVAIMTFIIPRFRNIFEQIQGEMPWFTQIFMQVYDAIMGHAHYIVLGLLIIIIALVSYSHTSKGHRQFSRILLGIPLIGRLISEGFVSIFCKTLSTLLESGVSIVDALNIINGLTTNDIIKSAISQSQNHITEGSNISISLAATDFFPGMVPKMVQIGESSGSLPKMLYRTSEYYQKRVNGTIKQLTAFLEPALIVVTGVIVLVVVLALYLPIFYISDM